MAAGKRSFKAYVEQELGKLPLFIIYTLLEWLLILLLFIDGFLALACKELARFFDMQMPCILCTNLLLVHHRHSDHHYNDSMCHAHKKQVSSLAFCHVHKQLSDIRKMCEGCLLSFATEKDSDCSTYKSLVGILQKDLDCFIHDVGGGNMLEWGERERERCSCCGEPLRMKRKAGSAVKAQFVGSGRNGEGGLNVVLPPIRFTELKFVDAAESEMPPDEAALPSIRTQGNLQGKEDVRSVQVPLISDAEDMSESIRTPMYGRCTNFFGIPLSDPSGGSPRWCGRAMKKSPLPLDKTEFASDSTEADIILNNLKRQVRLDRTSLMALYMELDEERSASAVAANNAMAMITRLQAEKAAVQMEALQYQRMMDEQAEYDQEALQEMHALLVQREEEVRVFETELKAYQRKYGLLKEEDFEFDEYEDLVPFSTEEDEDKGKVEEEPPRPAERMRTLKKVGGFRQHNGGRNKFPDIDNLVSTEA